jgi:regulator of replication initiation timing
MNDLFDTTDTIISAISEIATRLNSDELKNGIYILKGEIDSLKSSFNELISENAELRKKLEARNRGGTVAVDVIRC